MRFQVPVLRRMALLCALTALTLALPALAEDGGAAAPAQTPTASPAPATATAPPVAAAGMIAYVDPVTGGHTSTPTEEQRAAMRAALEHALSRSVEGLQEVVLPDGSVMVDLQGRFQEAVVARRAPDGTLHTFCVIDPDVALAPPAAPAEAPAGTVAVE